MSTQLSTATDALLARRGLPTRVTPDVLMIVLLDELCGRLADLNDLTATLKDLAVRQEAEMQKAPAEGKTRPFTETVTATQDSPEKWTVSDYILRDSCSYAIVDNRGDNSVWVCLNDLRDGFKEVRKSESIKFDYQGHSRIERFFFYVAAGASVDVEITLEY
jgi:hypothetical protein